MKYFQYTGSQPETGMVVMEVEMVSGTSHLLLLGKFVYGGGPIFKVVLEC